MIQVLELEYLPHLGLVVKFNLDQILLEFMYGFLI